MLKKKKRKKKSKLWAIKSNPSFQKSALTIKGNFNNRVHDILAAKHFLGSAADDSQ